MYYPLYIPRSDRLYTICGHNVEDETDFLFHCPRYLSIRDSFFSKIDHIISNPKRLLISTLIYGLLTKREVKMAGYWPSSFFACLWTETKSRSINTQKKNEANILPS